MIRLPSRLRLPARQAVRCDFCGATTRRVTLAEADDLAYLGWLPCTCGGTAFPPTAPHARRRTVQ